MRVVVGMSGGVDSSVAAWLLKQQGHEVIGMFMKNWHDESVTLSAECPWLEDSNDALLVANHLGIPFQAVDMSEEYRKRIVEYMFAEYERGRTPNPDVLCNREIKFDLFLKRALSLGADAVATGHYCQKEETTVNGKTTFHLLAGADGNKDQSYFLCQLNQYQLSKALFPIGHLKKNAVRELAGQAGLSTAAKKDSQGLCFIGKVSLPDFLQQQLKPKEGNVILIDEPGSAHSTFDFMNVSPADLNELAAPYDMQQFKQTVIGKHKGAHYYTIGQRKGLNIGGFKKPLFILATNTTTNEIFVGEGEEHSLLQRHALRICKNDIHWVRNDAMMQTDEKRNYTVRIRYRQKLEEACLYQTASDLYIVFKHKMKGITPGQFAAWYSGNELLGSGVIDK